MPEIKFGSMPGYLLTQGLDKEYERKMKEDRSQIKAIKKDIRENYISMRVCNNLGIKKDQIEKAVLQNKVRTRKLNNKVYYHKEDIMKRM